MPSESLVIYSFTVILVCYYKKALTPMEWALFKCLFWNANDLIVKLMVSITSGVSLWYRPCYKNVKLRQRQQMPKICDSIKVDFLWLKSRYWFSLRGLTWLENLRICLQSSNKLHKDVLHYRRFSFGYVIHFIVKI